MKETRDPSAAEDFREQRRRILAGLVAAGMAYAAPTLLTLNEARAASFPSRPSRPGYPSRRSRPSYASRPSRPGRPSHASRPSHPDRTWHSGGFSRQP